MDRPAAGERFRAWLVTGPLGRFAAFVIEIGAAIGRALRRRASTL
jgi:hypothetical protein